MKTIKRKVKEGRGQGRGRDYIPWLKVHEVPSRGRSSRIHGWKTEREHHMLSDLETKFFYLLEWSDVVVDIREQYPLLPIEETIDIAESLKVKHPTRVGTNDPKVMTTDFLVTFKDSAEKAQCLKYVADLNSRRSCEKLEIESIYWERRGIFWSIVTERQIPEETVTNISWFHSAYVIDGLSQKEINTLERVLKTEIQKAPRPLNSLTFDVDSRLGLAPGTSMDVIRHLIANRVFIVNLTKYINPHEPLELIPEATSASLLSGGDFNGTIY